MPKPGEIRYCPELGGQETNAAFVWIPPGSFWMGDRDQINNPTRFVVLSKGFWLQQMLLSKRQYLTRLALTVPMHQQVLELRMPQRGLSWTEIAEFCVGTPLRMPTEMEWEYATRSNTGHRYTYIGSNLQYRQSPVSVNQFYM